MSRELGLPKPPFSIAATMPSAGVALKSESHVAVDCDLACSLEEQGPHVFAVTRKLLEEFHNHMK